MQTIERKKKVAFLLPVFSGGGAERIVLQLADGLSHLYGWEVEIWATRFKGDSRRAVEARGYATVSVRDRCSRARHASLRASRALAQMVKERAVDVLVIEIGAIGYPELIEDTALVFHLHGQPLWELVPFSLPPAHASSLRERVRRLGEYLRKDLKERLFHTYTRRFMRRYRSMVEACAAYVVLCEGYRRELIERLELSAEQASRIRAIYNPAEQERFAATAAADKQREVLFVGRLSYADKRVDRLLRIWSVVESRHPDWTLRIVGDGPCLSQLREQARALGLQRVIFEGYQDPAPFYAWASVVALTSSFEGWPGALIEALAARCRPIAFRCSAGVGEILADGRGELIAPFDEEAYAAALDKMMTAGPQKSDPAAAAWLQTLDLRAIAPSWHSLLERVGNYSAKG